MKKSSKWIASHHGFSYFPYGRHALLIQWRIAKNRATLNKINQLSDLLNNANQTNILELVPAYHSLTIFFNPSITNPQYIINLIESFDLKTQPNKSKKNKKTWTIPVSYSSTVAEDIEYVAATLKLTIEEVVEIHSDTIYDVHFIGFLPGFLYLGGLDMRLDIPRRATPRLRVPSGSVAIAGGQTGIYPIDSPGGWHIIGKTDEILFDPMAIKPSPFQSGDKIKFEPI